MVAPGVREEIVTVWGASTLPPLGLNAGATTEPWRITLIVPAVASWEVSQVRPAATDGNTTVAKAPA